MTAGRLLARGRGAAVPTGFGHRERIAIGRAVAGFLAAALACGGITLLLRRIGGGFAVTPGPTLAWAVAAGGWALLAATELGCRIGGERWPGRLARVGLFAGALAVAPLGDGLPWPARLTAAMAVACGLAAAVLLPAPAGPIRIPTGRWRWPRPAAADGESSLRELPVGPAGVTAGPPGLRESPHPAADVDLPPSPDIPDGFRQRLERFETAAGLDCLRGLVVVAVPAGSRSGHAHVGFCPSFTAMPAVEVSSDCDFVEAEIAAAEILPWGARVECRLAEPAEEPLEIPVTIQARHQG